MKTFTAALAVLFVAVLCYQVSSSPPSLNHFGPCCPKFITRPLPLGFVRSYKHTGSYCSQPAVIFTTVKDRLVCASLDEKWVQDMMTQLKDKKLSE
ncbi:C-C motif chemokine 5-like [Myiozetetes cayanensis]|uniref:C-C motif chemokine 5-like n=1 Tax=Myiozetetes cayanensis TaxID=478635 RepID=UPI00215FA54F|nr:C-C motif chemokine 5-like [Myiozetetes cayanensis]